ncbi:MAG: bifunctional diguanylate cyclase/phosphohydrolase [Candidatus Limnocylindria bacterium]
MHSREARHMAWIGLVFGIAATAIALLVGPVPALTLGAGGLVGALSARRGLADGIAHHARQLAQATAAALESRDAGRLDPTTFGPLAPVAAGIAELRATLESAVEAAITDRLTHVANRPTLLATLFEEVERAARYGRPLTIAFLDVDHFKSVNDTYGHEIGDAVLGMLGTVLADNVRTSDTVGRYGGEEFVIIFAETAVDEATAVAEKLRLLISKQRVPVDGGEVSVTASIGLAGGHGQPLRVDDLLRDADAAMYAAKSLGRNQTYVFAEVDDDSARIPRSPISPEARAAAADVGDQARRAAESALASVIMPMSHYRGKPSALIATIAVRIARQLELPDAEIERIRVASLLHDIGKVAVPPEILEKAGPLSADEWQSVVQHPRIGQEILNRVATVKDAAAIILHHHERFSGHGYPHGLRGADIPIGARIVSLADAYEAMLSDRPYRAAIGHEAAIAEIRAHAETQFDPELVEVFCALFADAPPEADRTLLIMPQAPAELHRRPDARGARRARSRTMGSASGA